MVRVAALLVLDLALAACGRIGFAVEVDAALVDAPPDADVWLVPFSTPTLIPNISSDVEDDDPSMTEDGLELYFGSSRTGAGRTFRSVRTSIADAWSVPVEVTVLGSSNNPRVTLDGLAIWFSSTQTPSQSDDIWRATRPDRFQEFGPPIHVAELSSPMKDYEPSVPDDQGSIVFTSDRGGAQDMYIADRLQDDTFAPARSIAELSSGQYEGGSWTSPDGDTIWFHRGGANRVLLQSRRPGPGLPFDPPVEIPGAETMFDDQDPWVSPDGRTIIFASNRGGNADIYVATR